MWKKTEYGSNVIEIIMAKSGMTEDELLNPARHSPQTIKNLKEAAIMIVQAIRNHEHITVFGDYDADGICATTILVTLLKHLRADISYRLPRRMSEGYGISSKAIAEIDKGLLITVDNGIAANEPIHEAKEKGLKVIVIDHHLSGEELPEADLIVDPHVYPNDDGFEDYCGAGLSLKLAELFLSSEKKKNPDAVRDLYYKFVSLACVATVADVVPIKDENRWIVMQGLKLLSKRDKALPYGLVTMINEYGMGEKISETDIGFKIGPTLNAPGRLEDDGAEKAVKMLLSQFPEEANRRCMDLLAINEQRKKLAEEAKKSADLAIEKDPTLVEHAPLCLVLKNVPEGLVGIVTGKLTEDYHMPAFVFTKTHDGVLKGSGRTYGDVNLKELLDKCREFIIGGGGHASAAGVSCTEENYQKIVDCMKENLKDFVIEDTKDISYDMEIFDYQLGEIYSEVQQYAPYGAGNPAPVFVVNSTLTPRSGSHYKLLGKDQTHVKLLGNGYSAIAFGLASKYEEMGYPYKVKVVGKLSESSFRFSRELQIEAQDMELREERQKPQLFQKISAIEKL